MALPNVPPETPKTMEEITAQNVKSIADLERAAQGEDIVITSDGKPKAMIVRYRPVLRGKPWKSLAEFRAKIPMQPDSRALIDEDRAERW